MTSASRTHRPAGRILAAVAALAAAAALAGCAQIAASDRGDCTPTDRFAVERTGEASGPVVTDDGIATLVGTVIDASGAVLAQDQPISPNPDGSPGAIRVDALPAGLVELVRCAAAGQTVTATLNAEQVAGEPVAPMPGVDPAATQTISITVDRVYRSTASGRIALPQNGIPAVVNVPGGGHGVTMPATRAPIEPRVAETITGYGPEIAEGDVVVVQYSVHSWKSGDRLTSSWDSQQPQRLAAGNPEDAFGLSQALVGVASGSQLVVIAPADQLLMGGFSTFDADDAAVVVVDVLGVERPAAATGAEPNESAPAETEPAGTAPAETEPAGTEPAETAPTSTEETQP